LHSPLASFGSQASTGHWSTEFRFRTEMLTGRWPHPLPRLIRGEGRLRPFDAGVGSAAPCTPASDAKIGIRRSGRAPPESRVKAVSPVASPIRYHPRAIGEPIRVRPLARHERTAIRP
jgi:hypothetical protein